MLFFRLWILLLSVITTHVAIKQYDMGEICGRTVSMNDDDIYGFEALMNMTSQLSGTGRCHLTFEKRSDYSYLHFYFSAVDLPDCNTMSLYINEGDTVQSTVAHTDIPRVCGPMATSIVNDHYSSSRRYLALDFTWNPATTFRGSVFRLVANSYSCNDTCASGQDKCDDGPCINSYLDTTSGLDFCGGSLLCTVSSDDTGEAIAVTTMIGITFSIIFFLICVCSPSAAFRRGSRDNCRSDVSRCVQRCCDCCGGACDSCRRDCEPCCERTEQRLSDAKERLTECCGRIKDSWDQFSFPECAGGDHPVVTSPPSATPVMTEVATNTDTSTVDNETVVNTNSSAQIHNSDSDGENPDNFESYNPFHADGGASADPSAPPPSYSAAIRTRPPPPVPLAPPLDTPTDAPPSYEAAIDNPAFEPPEYDMVMANATFYGTKT